MLSSPKLIRRWQAPPAFLYIAELKCNSRWTLPHEAGGRPGKEYKLTKNDYDEDDDDHREIGLTYNLYSVNLKEI